MVFQSNRLDIKPSRRLLLLVMVVHLLALMAIMVALSQPWIVTGLTLLVIVHGYYIARRYVFLLSDHSVHALLWTSQGMEVVFANGVQLEVAVDGESVVMAGAVLLRLKMLSSRSYLRVPLFSDCCNADALRRLRVLLKCRLNAADSSVSASRDS
ncbi:MAG: protein YgfX [Motiliproteus sp.]